jgi:hypothetical protein
MDVDVDVQVDDITTENPMEVEMPSVLNMKMSNSALRLAVPVGGGKAGKISGKFLGTGGSGRRFFFILDYSASMGRDNLLVLKSHLMNALKSFKGAGEVALVFFAGPVWLPQEDGKAVRTKWNEAGQNFHCTKDGNLKLLPQPKWMVPNKHNLAILDKYICNTAKVLGTNWYLPFYIALKKMKPKPDVIFFMTDGAVSRDIVDKCMSLVKQYGKDVTINTIAFGAEKGWRDLEKLAKLSKNGTFKGYSRADLEKMAAGIILPSKFTSDTDFDYAVPKQAKVKEEKEVTGLTIE